jgi:hypothetical protein
MKERGKKEHGIVLGVKSDLALCWLLFGDAWRRYTSVPLSLRLHNTRPRAKPGKSGRGRRLPFGSIPSRLPLRRPSRLRHEALALSRLGHRVWPVLERVDGHGRRRGER